MFSSNYWHCKLKHKFSCQLQLQVLNVCELKIVLYTWICFTKKKNLDVNINYKKVWSSFSKLPVKCVTSCLWAHNWKIVSSKSSEDGINKHPLTELKKLEATSQMKDTDGSVFPASERSFALDRAAWSLSIILSTKVSPIKDSVGERKKDSMLWLLDKCDHSKALY